MGDAIESCGTDTSTTSSTMPGYASILSGRKLQRKNNILIHRPQFKKK